MPIAPRPLLPLVLLPVLAACGSHAATDAPQAAPQAATAQLPPPQTVVAPTNAYARWPNSLPTDPGFFPVAVWLQDPPNAQAFQQLGINTYVGLWQGPTSTQLQQLQQARMPVLAAQNATALQQPGTNPCAGWALPDEPDNAQWNGSSYGPCIAPAVVEANYLQWQATDPTRPVFLNLGRGVSFDTWIGRGVCTGQLQMYPSYMRGADIVCFDIYPVNATEPQVAGNLWYVAQGVQRLVEWNQQHFQGSKIVWNCVELSNIDGLALPTVAQVRAEVWMSIVHGSMGIVYFVHEFTPAFHECAVLTRQEPQYQTLRSGVTALNAQIRALAPVLNTATLDVGAKVESSAAGVPIATMTKRFGDSTYVFAVAMRNAPTTGKFLLDAVADCSSIEVVDEGRTIVPNGESFQDSFTGYEVHIYRIR